MRLLGWLYRNGETHPERQQPELAAAQRRLADAQARLEMLERRYRMQTLRARTGRRR